MEPENSSTNLQKITRVVLIFAILFVGSGIIYQTTRPEETDLLFFLLNENQEMRDYPTNTTLDTPANFHVFVDNQLNTPHNFSVRVYLCENTYNINSQQSVNDTIGATYLENQTIQLNDNQQWISNPFDIQFSTVGANQIIIIELWNEVDNSWVFIPNYMLILRISVYS